MAAHNQGIPLVRQNKGVADDVTEENGAAAAPSETTPNVDEKLLLHLHPDETENIEENADVKLTDKEKEPEEEDESDNLLHSTQSTPLSYGAGGSSLRQGRSGLADSKCDSKNSMGLGTGHNADEPPMMTYFRRFERDATALRREIRAGENWFESLLLGESSENRCQLVFSPSSASGDDPSSLRRQGGTGKTWNKNMLGESENARSQLVFSPPSASWEDPSLRRQGGTGKTWNKNMLGESENTRSQLVFSPPSASWEDPSSLRRQGGTGDDKGSASRKLFGTHAQTKRELVYSPPCLSGEDSSSLRRQRGTGKTLNKNMLGESENTRSQLVVSPPSASWEDPSSLRRQGGTGQNLVHIANLLSESFELLYQATRELLLGCWALYEVAIRHFGMGIALFLKSIVCLLYALYIAMKLLYQFVRIIIMYFRN